jgi:NAD(P)-dependent dehydrogenase (short-subunit alcohol dehydrogenase family)
MQANLKEQVALVTGAANGIGKSIADMLATNGAHVFYTDVDKNGVETAALGGGGHPLELNVTSDEQIQAAMKTVLDRFGRLDILVNNAGINTLKHRVTIDEFPREEWDRIIEVDLTAAYEMSRAASKIMKRQRGGRIINISSIGGVVPLRLQCAFTAAKAGLNNLTRAMAIELGRDGILVNAIAPGSIMTDGTRKLFYGSDGLFHENVQRMIDHIPLGRPGTTEEIAHAALFLAAPENTYLTGHILVVDGGWTAGYHRDF